MRKGDKIYVAGHRGLAGSALLRRLKSGGYASLVIRTHAELDLVDQAAVQRFFESERPDHVFLAAAKVGGIHANNTCPADFIFQNLAIQNNVIHCAWRSGVKRLLFLGSSCIYPRQCPQPMKEEYLLTGPLEPTNEPYAIAKIAGIKTCAAFNRQYGTNYLCVMPTNLYGPGDNYDLDSSHVLPALLRKMHEAKVAGARKVTVWGSGAPRREFMFSDDMADASVFVMEHCTPEQIGEFANIGTGADISIRELAHSIARVVGHRVELDFDSSKPDGMPRKLLDTRLINSLGWRSRTDLEAGLKLAYHAFLEETAATSAT